MKSLLKISWALLFVSSVLISCTENDDYDTIEYADKVKIDSVKIINDTMSVYEIQNIKTFSTYTSKCEGFYGYDYVHAPNLTRNVTAYQFHTNSDCAQEKYVSSNQIKFSPQIAGTYNFRFWNGDNNWITKTIVVQ